MDNFKEIIISLCRKGKAAKLIVYIFVNCLFVPWGERYKSKLLESLTLGSNNKAFAPNRTPDDWLTRDEKAVDKYVNDKLCGFTFTAKAYYLLPAHNMRCKDYIISIIKSQE